MAITETPQNSLEEWVQKILQGDSRTISRAISTVENRDAQAQELMKTLFRHTGRAAIIGITGAPGSGKSTLVSALAALLRGHNRQVGILAVDPTSPYTGGAILGDRVRMQAQSTDPGIYIRSMATRGALGGLSAATLDAVVVLDAAGKDFILIETVGVGQDEVEIARLADATLLLLVPGLGDEVQTFKAGVMEVADIFVLNKADQAGADRLETEIQNMLSSAPALTPWLPPIVRTVATEQRGVQDLLEAVFRFLEFSRQR
ncbi:MAG: methylmalonyl Co-A mutase-associated GTPase MeaB, partial [Acidobacteria bacterium]|nr:methylmalonyl Co-A mutase-associated GTPase MeaB [Acidobacteriota bacterium]